MWNNKYEVEIHIKESEKMYFGSATFFIIENRGRDGNTRAFKTKIQRIFMAVYLLNIYTSKELTYIM
jgi:hypothetical protein